MVGTNRAQLGSARARLTAAAAGAVGRPQTVQTGATCLCRASLINYVCESLARARASTSLFSAPPRARPAPSHRTIHSRGSSDARR